MSGQSANRFWQTDFKRITPQALTPQKLSAPDLLIVFGLLLAFVPWMAGGRDALAMLISAAGLAVAGMLALRRYSLNGVSSPVLAISIGVWLSWGALSQLWSVNRYQSQLWLMMMLLAALAAIITVVQPRLNRQWLIGGYLIMATIMVLAGLYMYLTGDYDRFTSTFYWANPAAAYLLPAVLLATWWGVRYRWWWMMVVALITATGFWLTDSRGATLTLALVAGLSFAASQRVRQRWKGILLVAVLSFAAAWGVTLLKSNHQAVQPGSRYVEAAQGESTSGKDRLSYLSDSLAIWWDHPLAGTGAGTFATVHPQYQTSATNASTDPHNIYVQALAEQGIVGACLLAWVLLLIIAGVINGVSRHPQCAPLALAAGALLIHFGLDINGRYPALLVLVAVLLALVYQPLIRSDAPRHARPTIMLLLALTLGLVSANYLSVHARQNAEIHNDNGDFDLAAQANQQSHQIVIHDPDSWNAEGIDYFVLASINNDRQANLAKARDLANQAIQRDPLDAQHYFLLGRVERLAGNPQAAKQAFERTLQLDRYNHAEYYADLVALQLSQGDLDGARQTVDTALTIFTDQVIANRSADTRLKPAVEQLRMFKDQIQQQTQSQLPSS